MKTETEIRVKWDELVMQRDDAQPCSRCRSLLNERLVVLAWVLDRREVPDLALSPDSFALLDCVG